MLPFRHARLLFAGLLFVTATLSQPAWALGQTPNRYALLHIQNKTPDITITYYVRWGTSAEWGKPIVLKPGEGWNHWWQYATPNQNSSPTPQVKFQMGINKAREAKIYDLRAFAVPANNQGGKNYNFEKDSDAKGDAYLDLFSAPAPEIVAKKSLPTSAERQKAIQALEAFRMGSTLTPEKLKTINELPSGELMDKPSATMSPQTKKFIEAEISRYQQLEYEMTAAADVFLNAALLRPQDREARGMKLLWLFGPVTAPNARPESKDGLGGLRIIGRLNLPDGKQINSIFALKYYPNPNTFSEAEGKVGLLGKGDNFRLEIRMFKTGDTKNDYAFHSFSVSDEGRDMKMRPGFYVDTMSGMVNDKELVSMALGTSCMNCHLSGPKLKATDLDLMEKKHHAAMEGFKPFVEQLKHWGASKSFRNEIEQIMLTDGPSALLPLQDMLAANREHWISIYTRKGTSGPVLPKLAGTTWNGSESLAGFGKLAFQFKADGTATMTDAKSSINGKWTIEANRVVITFNNCTYVGQWDGQALRGTGQFMEKEQPTGKAWTFSVALGKADE